MSGGERACWLPSAVELPPSRERGIQPARSPIAVEARSICGRTKRRGFGFVGSTIVSAHMQAVGMVKDHVLGCFRQREVARNG